MKGLLLKDFQIIFKEGRIAFLMLAAYFLLGFATDSFALMGAAMCAVFCATLPISTMAYDERAKWDKYVLTMPVFRATVAVSKYLLVLLLFAASFCIITISRIIMGASLGSVLSETVALLCGCLLFTSVNFPISFRFGVEKGRIAMLLTFLIPFILVFLAEKFAWFDFEALFSKSISVWFPAAAFLLYLLSMLLSIRIYLKKEF